LVEFYEPSEDEHFKREMSDTRRAKLTFKHLQRLRKYKDMKEEERLEHLKFVRHMYKTVDPEAEALGGELGGDEFGI